MTAEDEARQANERIVVNGSEQDFRRFVYTHFCSLKAGLDDIKDNGCAKACSKGSLLDKWTPAAVGTALMGALIGAIEYFKSVK